MDLSSGNADAWSDYIEWKYCFNTVHTTLRAPLIMYNFRHTIPKLGLASLLRF